MSGMALIQFLSQGRCVLFVALNILGIFMYVHNKRMFKIKPLKSTMCDPTKKRNKTQTFAVVNGLFLTRK
jgi:hypothetical protein